MYAHAWWNKGLPEARVSAWGDRRIRPAIVNLVAGAVGIILHGWMNAKLKSHRAVADLQRAS